VKTNRVNAGGRRNRRNARRLSLLDLYPTLTFRNRCKFDGEMSNAHQWGLAATAQPVAKGFSRERLAEVEPPAARIMSMRARNAAGTCRRPG
jgi:hypothetical protein